MKHYEKLAAKHVKELLVPEYRNVGKKAFVAGFKAAIEELRNDELCSKKLDPNTYPYNQEIANFLDREEL